MYLSIYLTN